jgi:quinolinate synthase
MLGTQSITDEILDLKRQRRAVLLAHHYQEAEIQEIADVVGDSLELSRKAREFEGDVIAFCGVWFMAETAKILSPERIVVVPDAEAGCSLVDCCPVEQVQAYKRRYPDHVIVSYINTSAAVKAESDILCTSRNAVDVVNSIPRDKTILFLPDRNLGRYVQRQTGRENFKIWQGACVVHATFSGRRVAAMKSEHPNALVAAHPESAQDALLQADYVGSTSAIINWCVEHPGEEFVIVTENGVNYSLTKRAPEKKFYFVNNEQCNCSECPHMRRNNLEKLRDCLLNLEPRMELSEDVIRKALLPLDRMLAVKVSK